MRVAVIYDFGVNKGGGDFVMLNVLEALNNAGCEISLLTSRLEGLRESAEFFGKCAPNVDVHRIRVPRLLKHPYTLAYIAREVGKVRSNPYEMYIVSDDIPKSIADKRGICYVHYPHSARFKFKEYVATKYKTTLCGKLVWRLHEILFPRFYTTDPLGNWLLIANSIVTRRHVAEVSRVSEERVALLNPPVSSLEINRCWKNSSIEKEDTAVCIGRFEPEKRFMDALYAVVQLKDKLKLSLIGFADSEEELMRTIKDLGLESNVKLLVNADRKTIIDSLLRAKAIIHPTPHEPFGIAVVEGMAAGCIPIVRRGFNGPWMEITQGGRYGLGFSSIEELANTLEKAIGCYNSFDIKAITLRALEFDEAGFRRRFLEIFENFLGT